MNRLIGSSRIRAAADGPGPSTLPEAAAGLHAAAMATYSLFLRSTDATLFEGARLLQVVAGSLDELLRAVEGRLLRYDERREPAAPLGARLLRLVGADGVALRDEAFEALPLRGRYTVERVSSGPGLSETSAAAHASSNTGAGTAAVGEERASVAAARDASAAVRSRELVVCLDYDAWRAAVLEQFQQEPGFEALRWKSGQQAVVRFGSGQEAAAAAAAPRHTNGQPRTVSTPLEVLPADTETSYAHCVLSDSIEGNKWLLKAQKTGGASALLHIVRAAIAGAGHMHAPAAGEIPAMPMPCRARLCNSSSSGGGGSRQDTDNGAQSSRLLLVLGFRDASEASAAVAASTDDGKRSCWALQLGVMEEAAEEQPSCGLRCPLVLGSGGVGLLRR